MLIRTLNYSIVTTTDLLEDFSAPGHDHKLVTNLENL